jgi:hypothetical protein
MFPNVRLMVVAILAAIAGIGCGLGLFATFRVNHEPLVRLAEGSPPLQLAFADLTLGSNIGAPLPARLPVSGAATVISVPVIAATPGPAAEQAEGDAASAGDSGVEQAAAGAGTADQNEQSNTTNLAASLTTSLTTSLAAAAAPEQASVPPETTAATPSQQAVIAAAQDQQPAAAAAAPTGEQTAATNPANDPEPNSKPTETSESQATKPKARAARPAARPTAQARRAVKPARARRTATAQSVYQYPQPTYSQPTYTWTDGSAQASQPVKRVQIKRHRAAKKALPAAQSNPSAATAGLSVTQ